MWDVRCWMRDFELTGYLKPLKGLNAEEDYFSYLNLDLSILIFEFQI